MSENINIDKSIASKTKFNKVFESAKNFFEWATKTVLILGITLVVFAFCTVFYQEYNRNAYTVQEFVVPKYFEESGLNGEVLGRKIIDELKQLKQKASSEQDDEAGFETMENDETAAEITLGGTGLSISQLVEIAKALLHKPTRKITGELVLLDSVLLLTLRATGENAITIEQPFRDSNLLNSLDTLLEKAGEKVAKVLMPLTLGIYYQNTYREKQAIELLEHCVLALPHEDDKYACIHLAELLFAEKDTVGAIAKIEKALEIDENFSDAYITWAKLLQDMKDSTNAVKKYQAAVEVEEENTRIYKSWGRFLGGKKDSIGAVKQFMKGLAINPNDGEIYYEWAYFLRFHRKKYI
jgi:tetratricopeptide (TPR) repeat protein